MARRRRSAPRAVKVRVRRRRGTAGFVSAGKLLPGGVRGAAIGAAAGAAGFALVNTLVNRAPAQFQSGWARILAKVAIAAGLFMLGKKILPRHAGALAAGALIPPALDTWNRVKPMELAGPPAGPLSGYGPMLEGLGEPGGLPQLGALEDAPPIFV